MPNFQPNSSSLTKGCIPLHYAAYYNVPWNLVEEMVLLYREGLTKTTNSNYIPADYVDFEPEGVFGNGMSFEEAEANKEKLQEVSTM